MHRLQTDAAQADGRSGCFASPQSCLVSVPAGAGYTASAGIATNKLLAKIGSAMVSSQL